MRSILAAMHTKASTSAGGWHRAGVRVLVAIILAVSGLILPGSFISTAAPSCAPRLPGGSSTLPQCRILLLHPGPGDYAADWAGQLLAQGYAVDLLLVDSPSVDRSLDAYHLVVV